MMWLGVKLFASILFGTLCAFWTCMTVPFTKLEFSFIIFSNSFPISFSSPSGTPMMQMSVQLKLSQRLLVLLSFLWILFSSSCYDWLFFASLCSKLLIWFLAFFTLLLFPCKLFFISISVPFISDWIFLCCWGPRDISWASLYPVFWTLHLLDCLSPFCLVFLLEF